MRGIHSQSYYQHDISAGHEGETEAKDWSTRSLRELLHEYRRHVTPGFCYFLGKYEDEHLVNIDEVRVPFSKATGSTVRKVIFAYFEKGYPEDSLARKGYEYWRHHYPFAHHEAATGSEFQDKLATYIRDRLIELSGAG